MRWYMFLFSFCCCEEKRREKKNSSKPAWGGTDSLHLPCWICHQGTSGQELMPEAWSQKLGLWKGHGLAYFLCCTQLLFLYNHGPRHGTAHSGPGLPTSVETNRMLQGPQTCPQASLPEVVTHQVSFPFSRCLLTVSNWQRQRSTVSIWDFFPKAAMVIHCYQRHQPSALEAEPG